MEPSLRGFGATPRSGHSRRIPWVGGVAMGDTAVAEVAAATFPRCLALDPPGARMGVGKEEKEDGAVSG